MQRDCRGIFVEDAMLLSPILIAGNHGPARAAACQAPPPPGWITARSREFVLFALISLFYDAHRIDRYQLICARYLMP